MEAGADLRDVFQESLNCAIAHGQRPAQWICLGDKTRTAIEAVAQEHPDATAGHIADAYDAFASEHQAAVATVSPPAEGPKRLEARRGRFERR